MRWLLTGDEFDADEAHRIGLVQEVVDDGAAALVRAREIATPSPIAPPRSALRQSWRRRTWRVPRVTPPRSSGCAPK